MDWTAFKVKKEAPLPQQVMHAFQKAGFSQEGARVLAAEVGREGGFKPENVYGVHTDPKNQAQNIGMISWQGDRATALRSHLEKKGLLTGNTIKKGQESLVAQAEFLMKEMKSGAHGGGKKLVSMLQSESVDYTEAAKRIGKDYIKWRYDDPEFSSGHKNRDKFYKQLGGNPTANAATDWAKFKPAAEKVDWKAYKVKGE